MIFPRCRIRIRDDHVIVEMAERLGAHVTRLRAPFSPEPGAYAEASAAGVMQAAS